MQNMKTAPHGNNQRPTWANKNTDYAPPADTKNVPPRVSAWQLFFSLNYSEKHGKKRNLMSNDDQAA